MGRQWIRPCVGCKWLFLFVKWTPWFRFSLLRPCLYRLSLHWILFYISNNGLAYFSEHGPNWAHGGFLVKKDTKVQLKAPQCSTQSLTRIYDLGSKKKRKKRERIWCVYIYNFNWFRCGYCNCLSFVFEYWRVSWGANGKYHVLS